MANARELILKALYQIENEGAYSGKALKLLLQNKDLPAADRGFATELLMGVVRNKLHLDYVIGQFSSVKLKKLSPWIHEILRMGVYQILFMEKIPDSAACNESVKLGARYSKGASRGFVNGVLRNIARNKEHIRYPKELLDYLQVRYSCPLWLTELLLSQYGAEACEAILKASLQSYPASLRTNLTKTTTADLAKRLEEEGVSTYSMDGNPRGLYVAGALNVNCSKAYKEGLYTLQNSSSMAAVELLAPKKHEKLLDLCAAPGGKTTYAAELMENTGEVLACDIHAHKIPLIESAAKRLGLANIKTKLQDAGVFVPEWENAFDRVLADVPCSGIGVIHKKPDIKWKRKAEDIAALCEIQRRILQNAGRYVKSGGCLVYSTCTILKEENQAQTAWFLRQFPDFSPVEEKQILTHQTGGSGFYMAKFLRK